MSRQHAVAESVASKESQDRVWDAFRRWGYLQADLDPLGDLQPVAMPELEVTGAEADAARRFYCGTIGVEFMHIADRERREWVQQRMESEAPEVDRERILEWLVRAEIFEQVLQTRYLGTKRFSLEGEAALLPLLDAILSAGAEQGLQQAMLAMSHRGRLNVMVHVVGRGAAEVFARFEDVDPRSVLGGVDVNYHIGATGDFSAADGRTVGIHLVSNPSHLEAVDPVAMGRARARQVRLGESGQTKVLPVLIHGDAAFVGQGIWAETLSLGAMPGFTVGGTIQIIVNNLIGFTADPDESYSSRYSSDIGRRLPIPIFHVNGEDAEAAIRVAALAIEYRYTFHTDVIIDLVGYRRHGHSEVDDPTITQPLRYEKIKNHPPLYEIYGKQIGVDPSARVKEIQTELAEAQKQAARMAKRVALAKLPDYWSNYSGGPYKPEYEVDTGLSAARIEEISNSLTTYPRQFHIHPKIKKLLEQRREMGRGERLFDYGMAEALAFGSLSLQGTPVRLRGQDSQRGTFNQRHSVLVDIENEQLYFPIANLAPDQARIEIYNSMLSEAGVLGFEYGSSRDYPEALVLWEAQFGDFANGAQIIIDQFIASG